MAVTLRPKQDEDDQFLYEVYASTREEELALTGWTEAQKEGFLRMQYSAQTRYYQQVYPHMDYRIILNEGAPAGRFIVARLEKEIRLVDISLIRGHRGTSIGQELLHGLLDEARRAGKPVVLHVEHFNRARHLYERLGFRPAGDAGVYTRMEWLPQFERSHG